MIWLEGKLWNGSELLGMRKFTWIVIIATLLALAAPVRVLAAGGNILYLITWGGYAGNTLVYVQTTIQATERTNNSNLNYTITGPGSDPTIRASHTTPIGRLNAWNTVTDEWSVMNTDWPEGDYTVRLCWSTGASTNCNIAGPVTSVFHSVPTLGWLLAAGGLGILFLFLWRRRNDFAFSGKAGTA